MKFKLSLLLVMVCTFAYSQKITPHRLSLVVSDLNQSSLWYQDVLNMKVYHEINYPEYDSLQIYFLKNESFELELLEKATSFRIQDYRPKYSVNREPMIGPYKVGFIVDDLEAFHLKLKKLKANILYGITTDETFNTRWLIVADPDGNSLQFYQPL